MSSKSLTIGNQQMTTLAIGIAIVLLIMYFMRKNSLATRISNAETWNWEDWKGRQRQITVHRDVKAS